MRRQCRGDQTAPDTSPPHLTRDTPRMGGTKICRQCNAEKPVGEFDIKYKINDREYRCVICRACEIVRTQRWKAARLSRRNPPTGGPVTSASS